MSGAGKPKLTEAQRRLLVELREPPPAKTPAVAAAGGWRFLWPIGGPASGCLRGGARTVVASKLVRTGLAEWSVGMVRITPAGLAAFGGAMTVHRTTEEYAAAPWDEGDYTVATAAAP